MSRWRAVLGSVIAVVVVLLTAATAYAQLSTATFKGKVTKGEAPAAAGLSVTAANKESGFTYRATTQTGGVYVITGVPPGPYELRIAGSEGVARSEVITVAVGQTVTVDLILAKKEATEEIVVTGTRLRQAVATSEVGSNVSIEMVEAMPTATHNFLAGVDLVPGVQFVQDPNSGYTKIQSGGQSANNVTVFVDGVNQKNNILPGGMVGQDSSRGNPFPQSAVREYKVITQNYKAEYDQVSSAAISAVTKSGGNELHGGAYVDRTETDWRAKSTFDKQKERDSGKPLPASSKNEFGASVGGAIVPDVVNYFVAYDGKNINDSRIVRPPPASLDLLPAELGIVPTLAAQSGTKVDPFLEHLAFGKVNAAYGDDRRLTAEVRVRSEADTVPENSEFSAEGNDKNRSNKEYRFDVMHEMSIGSDWLAETKAGYQYSSWSPKSNSKAPSVKYKVSNASMDAILANGDSAQQLSSSSDIIFMGGSPDYQKKSQSGFGLTQDFTFTGLLDNVFKAGAKVNFLKYDLSGTKRYVDVVETLVSRVTGLPYFNGTNCEGTNPQGSDFLATDQCRIQTKLPMSNTTMNNTQIGLYVQDDWTLFDKLELNLGVRWDVETNMLNNGYVTPQDRIDALKGLDTRTLDGATAPEGQTYADSLAKGGIDIDDYISNGHSRKVFMGAFAPRLGFSFDLFGDKGTVFYGGFGRSYDRQIADSAIAEKDNNGVAMKSSVKPDIFLVKNEFKMPYADQFGAGVRQGVFDWNLDVGFSWLEGYNQFQWFSGNRDFDGGYGGANAFSAMWGGPNGYNNLVLGDFVGRNRTKALMAKVEKPYTKASGWTASLAYTYSDAQTQHTDWNSDAFDWIYGRSTHTWHRSTLVEKNRVVAAGMYDIEAWDFMVTARATYGSGLPRRVTRSDGTLFEDYSPAFMQVDLGVVKTFKTTLGNFSLRGDVLNLLDRSNYVRGNNDAGDLATTGAANPFGGTASNTDQYTGLRGPRRTVKVAMALDF